MKKTTQESVKKVANFKDKNQNDKPVNRQLQSTKPTCKNIEASKQKIKYEPMPKPLPVKIVKIYERKHAANYSEAEKKRRQAKKLEYSNKVGWMERIGRHRHAHQARREKEILNYMNGLPLDYGMSDDSG